MLEVDRLSKTYVDRKRNSSLLVLDKLSFSVPTGQFLCVLGQSGCGKTTFLRIAAGLTPYESGSVIVDGERVSGPGQNRSMVFQNYGLLPWRTVLGNVELSLEIRGVPKAERKEKAGEQIEKLGLAGFESHYPHEISGGMQQRVGLARAFTKDPKVLLMDEPFAAVDAQTREYLQEELLKIWSLIRTTVVFVTHSIDEAAYLADRVLILSPGGGHIKADITVDLPRPRFDHDVKLSLRYIEILKELRDALMSDSQVEPPG